MYFKLFILSLLSPLLLSCKTIEVYDYVHEPTNHIRNRIIWGYGDNLSVPHYTNEAVLFIPNLRTFTYSFSSPRYVNLYSCSMKKEHFFLENVTLINGDTKYQVKKEFNTTISIEKKVSSQHREYKHLCKFISLFKDTNFNYAEHFANASSLILKVNYRYPGSSQTKEKVFKVYLKRVKQIAWPT